MSTENEIVSNWKKEYNEQILVRIEKRQKLIDLGENPYANDRFPDTKSSELRKSYDEFSKEEIEEKSEGREFCVLGRILSIRDFGKAAFLKFDDGHGVIQIYVRKGTVSDLGHQIYKLADYGDIVWAKGTVFKTNKGELSLNALDFKIMTKSLRPLPEKFHGLTEAELRYRMRYVDMIMNQNVRESFQLRSNIVRKIREFFYSKDFLEVETPMLHSVVGGAAAKPFNTHHNALGLDMTLRIAPELHLKRLVVGGMPKVFEMNRCFRNEGLSLKHNPEFTSLEFYEAYVTYEAHIKLVEELLSKLVTETFGKESVTFGDKEISFQRPFRRVTIREVVAEHFNVNVEKLEEKEFLLEKLQKKIDDKKQLAQLSSFSVDKLLVLCFEEFVEETLIHPTFVCEYPTEISPLARRNDKNPRFVDRFELFINGWEVANAFSELNNPDDQLERFAEQAKLKEQGDEEACDVDYDYVRALEYGLPPTGGVGIGIDRLVMILTGKATIRDVILFPQLKKEHFFDERTDCDE